MSRCLRNAVLALCCAAPIALVAHAWAGEDYSKKAGQAAGKAESMTPADMAAMMPKPGPMHAQLAKMVGKWTYKNSMKMDPNAPAMVTDGTEEVTSVCGGLYFMVTSTSGGPMPFEGHGIMAYDESKKKFTGAWVDNMGTAIYMMEGTPKADGTVVNYTMTGPDPQTGGTMNCAMVCEMKTPSARTMKMWHGPKAEGEPMMVINYTKAGTTVGSR
jgi:hypothetical protein